MKKTSKIALAATASVVIGALGFALPSLAHDSSQGTKSFASAECSHDPMEQGSGEKMSEGKQAGKGEGFRGKREQHREGHGNEAEVAPSN